LNKLILKTPKTKSLIKTTINDKKGIKQKLNRKSPKALYQYNPQVRIKNNKNKKAKNLKNPF